VTLLPVHRKAIDTAEVQYRQLDSERYKLHCEVHRLTRAGMSALAIATLLGISDRQVQRIRGAEEPAQKFYQFDTSDERARELERTAHAVIDLACRIKDEDPQLVFKAIELMDEDALRELLMVALAGIPIHMTAEQLFGWCQQ
jgi:predicted transcriptional regulator